MLAHPGRPTRPPRGATAIVVAILIAVLVLFLALVVDVGHLLSVRGELQNASDAGALAGAKELDGTVDHLAPAVTSGADFAGRHETDGNVDVVADHVELGHWTRPEEACSVYGGVQSGHTRTSGYWANWKFCRIDGRDAAAALDINAVRVASARATGAEGGGPAPVFFGGMFGKGTADVRSEAVGVAGGPCEQECPRIPLVIRAGCLNGGAGLECNSSYVIGLSSAVVDTAGWTSLDPDDPASTPTICDRLSHPPDCELTAGMQIRTANGTQLNPPCQDPATGEKPSLCEWFQRLIGTQAQIPVVEYPGEEGICNLNYNGTARVVGFATFAITGAWCKTGDTEVGVCDPYAQKKCISLQFICDVQDDEDVPVGCGWWGTSPLRPQLVR